MFVIDGDGTPALDTWIERVVDATTTTEVAIDLFPSGERPELQGPLTVLVLGQTDGDLTSAGTETAPLQTALLLTQLSPAGHANCPLILAHTHSEGR